MCAIIGALLWDIRGDNRSRAERILRTIWARSHERGRDGRGWVLQSVHDDSFDAPVERTQQKYPVRLESVEEHRAHAPRLAEFSQGVFIANLRAEPTTEFIARKMPVDQQPYRSGSWTIVHNGTIANDAEIRARPCPDPVPTRIDSAAIAELLTQETLYDSMYSGETDDNYELFHRAVCQLKGSYAILAADDSASRLYVAANYRPIWYVDTDIGIFFASSADYFPVGVPTMLEPYSTAVFSRSLEGFDVRMTPLPRGTRKGARRAVVVCSGGLDSVVSAAYAQRELGYDIHLLHFCYGSRAETREVEAVQAVGRALAAPVTVFPLPVYKPGDSPLLDADAAVAGGEAGAEFAHEWVPARNLLLLSVAAAFAEANGFEVLVLGNNLEEAGAYPDNEPEFVKRFDALLPFAVGDGRKLNVIMPVGNLMKHEIVKLGLAVDAPLHLTWSCYRAGRLHCGRCGPCYMRRTAFNINNAEEVIEYEVPVDKDVRA